MELKAVLSVLEQAEGSEALLRTGVALARAHAAHLVGLHVIDIPAFPTYVDAQLPAEVLLMRHRYYEEAAGAVRAAFERACSEAGVEGEWRCVEGGLRPTVETHARFADLVVVSASGGRDEEDRRRAPIADELVLSAGRPVLVVPDQAAVTTIGEYVVVAWDGSREAARAVTDAMPLLRAARQVAVVVIHSADTERALGELPGADLSHFLARHGVKAEAQGLEFAGRTVGDALLGWTKGQGADLLVMGAYGHSRFREVLLGGTTRHVLQHAALPVLMSH